MKLELSCLATKKQLHLEINGEACLSESTILTVKYKGGSIMWECFAAGGISALHTIDGIMRKERYVEILTQHLKT